MTTQDGSAVDTTAPAAETAPTGAPAPLDTVRCPLCGAVGTLHVLTPRGRLRVGWLSFLFTLGRTHECGACHGAVTLYPFADRAGERT